MFKNPLDSTENKKGIATLKKNIAKKMKMSDRKNGSDPQKHWDEDHINSPRKDCVTCKGFGR